MRILLTGATGFIGRHLLPALLARGHEVVCAVRNPSRLESASVKTVAADFTHDHDPATWLPRLQGVDAVINAVGIIREQGQQTFDAIHHLAPAALFRACAQAGVRRVVQVSALGADESAVSRYHLSKRQADEVLAGLPLSSAIVQPSVVYGADGTSAALFTTLASLPVLGLPGGGVQQLQPVHVDDVVEAVLRLLDTEGPQGNGGRLAVVGAKAMSLKAFLLQLASAMHARQPLTLPIPMFLVRAGAAIAAKIPGSLLDAETLGMLERGNTGDAAPLTGLLGHGPKPVAQFISPGERAPVLTRARLNWLLPLLRASIALVWIVTGIISFGIFPVEESYALLQRAGIPQALQPLMLYGAAAMDLAIGLGILLLKRRRWLWLLQFVVIVGYTAIISIRLPEFWLHPYGPLLKNVPMLAAILCVMELEQD